MSIVTHLDYFGHRLAHLGPFSLAGMVFNMQDDQLALGGALQKRFLFNMGDVWPSLELWQLISASVKREERSRGKIKSARFQQDTS